jgi:hypothetical protein
MLYGALLGPRFGAALTAGCVNCTPGWESADGGLLLGQQQARWCRAKSTHDNAQPLQSITKNVWRVAARYVCTDVVKVVEIQGPVISDRKEVVLAPLASVLTLIT